MSAPKVKPSVPATEFAKNFGEYRVAAQRGPIAVSSNGKLSGYFVAADDYERMVRVMARTKEADTLGGDFARLVESVPPSRRVEPVPGVKGQAHWIADLGEDIADELAATGMDPQFQRLNALLGK